MTDRKQLVYDLAMALEERISSKFYFNEDIFNVNGCLLHFLNYSVNIMQEVRKFLGHYNHITVPGSMQDSIRIFIFPSQFMSEALQIFGEGEILHSSFLYPGVPFNVYKWEELLLFTVLNDRCALLDIKRRVVICCAPENLSGNRLRSVVNTLIFPVLNEFFAIMGQYFLHCASVAKGQSGILFASPSGGGKTTMTLSLLRAGYRLLGDDITILDANGPLPRFVSFRKDMRICPDTLLMFPELFHLAENPLNSGKVEVHPEDIFPGCLMDFALAHIVLFPVEDMEEGVDYSLIDTDEALEYLVPNSLFIAGKYEFHPRLFALTDMLTAVRAYKIRSRVDIKRLPSIIDGIISE